MVTNKKRLFQYKNPDTLEITKVLRNNIYTLPFSQRDILRNSNSEFNVNTQLQQLFDDQIVTIFPTIYDPRRGIYTSQYEDTIHILESETINLTG
jgi:hypothetical protein